MDFDRKEELRKLMEPSISGDEDAIFKVIGLFMKRIRNKSYYEDRFIEDIKFEIIEKLYFDIPKFKGLKNNLKNF